MMNEPTKSKYLVPSFQNIEAFVIFHSLDSLSPRGMNSEKTWECER